MSRYDFMASFLAVYRSKSLTQAARELGLSQPAISMHLKSLEEAIGKPLFQRGPRGAEPTTAAHELAGEINNSFDLLDATWKDYQMTSSQYAGPVYIGAESEVLTHYLLPKLAALDTEKIHPYFSVGTATKLANRLIDQTLDLLIYHTGYEDPPEHDPNLLDEVVIHEANLVLVGNPEWASRIDQAALAEGDGSELTNVLTKINWVVYAMERNFLTRYMREVFDRGIGDLKIVSSIPDIAGMQQALKLGMGVGILPDFTCQDLLASGELVLLHESAQAPGIDINLLSLKPSKLNTLAKQVRQHVESGL